MAVVNIYIENLILDILKVSHIIQVFKFYALRQCSCTVKKQATENNR